jgi:hypothetical protein
MHRARSLKELLHQPRPTLVGWVFEKLFDSAATPAAVGTRGGSLQERRVLVQFGPPGDPAGQLDVLVRRETSRTIAVHAQLVPMLDGVDLSIMAGKRPIKTKLSEVGDVYVRGLQGSTGLAVVLSSRSGERLVIDDLDLPRGAKA